MVVSEKDFFRIFFSIIGGLCIGIGILSMLGVVNNIGLKFGLFFFVIGGVAFYMANNAGTYVNPALMIFAKNH